MRFYRYIAATFLVVCMCGAVRSQNITLPYDFTISGRDTSTSEILNSLQSPTPMANVTVDANGHFTTGQGGRIRFFGTELDFNSQFLDAQDCKLLAKHLRKLGFNAVRMNYNDYSYAVDISFINTSGYPNNSYVLDSLQIAKFDTLLYALKNEGIYTFIIFNNYHYLYPNESFYSDSLWGLSNYVHYIDPKVAQIQRNWAKTLLGHRNPLTGLRIGDDPVLAGVELSANQNLFYGWHYDFINYVDSNNYYNKGGRQTISFKMSRRLDTLYSQYLLKKYGSDVGINLAWKGNATVDPSNRIANGSFEKISSTIWAFNAGNGASGGKAIVGGAIDSQFCLLVQLDNIGPNPYWSDAYLQNVSARLGKDTLYELSYWAKINHQTSPNVLKRSVLSYFADYNIGTAVVSQYDTIDTNWKQIKVQFRALSTGIYVLYFGLGQQLGDVLFDGVVIKQIPETGLYPGETTAKSLIYRLRYSEAPLVTFQRARDQSQFYDSLQRTYYHSMRSVIKDSLGAKCLVNYYCGEWWALPLDANLNAESDYTSSLTNTDYYTYRTGLPSVDTNLRMVYNTSNLFEPSNYYVGLLSAQSVEGKPHIGQFFNPSLNQYYAASVPFFAAYASLQDWDGFFLQRYAYYRQEVLCDSIFDPIKNQASNYYNIVGNPGILSVMPAASSLFRGGKVKTSETYVPITHVPDDIDLYAAARDSRAPYGVEGNLDPRISTMFKVRQKFGATKHKVASEYPYVADTSAKISETGELWWQPSSGFMTINADRAAGAVGFFGLDTIKLRSLAFRRLDNARDNLTLLLLPLDTLTVMNSPSQLLTLTTRGQNGDMIWSSDSLGVGVNYGHAPTVLSAAKLEVFIHSDSNRVVFHPLDGTGNLRSRAIEAKRMDTIGTGFVAMLDQSKDRSPWYWIEMTNAVNAVRRDAETPSRFDVRIFPNPVRSEAKIFLDISTETSVTLTLLDVLGRNEIRIASERLGAGEYEYPLDVSALSSGSYILRAECAGKVITRSVAVVK